MIINKFYATRAIKSFCEYPLLSVYEIFRVIMKYRAIIHIMEIIREEIIAKTKIDTARTVPSASIAENAQEETPPKVQFALFCFEEKKAFIVASLRNFSLFYHAGSNL